MKNNALHIILMPILAVCILVSTSSFTVNKRFCGESLIEASLFAELQNCKHTSCANLQTERNQTFKIAKDCCKETSNVVYGKENLVLKKLESKKIKVQKQEFLSTTFAISVSLRNFDAKVAAVFYEPPLLVQKNLFRHYQVFII